MFARRRGCGLAVMTCRVDEIELGITAWAGTAFALTMRGHRAQSIVAATIIPGRRRATELEDVNRICGGGNTEEGGGGVERHTVDAGRYRATAELVEFACRRDGEDANYGSFVGCSGEEGASVVDVNTRER